MFVSNLVSKMVNDALCHVSRAIFHVSGSNIVWRVQGQLSPGKPGRQGRQATKGREAVKKVIKCNYRNYCLSLIQSH